MPIRVAVLLVVACVAGSAPAAAQFARPAPLAPGEDFQVEFGAMLWRPTPELHVGAGLGTEGEEPADLAQAFGLDRSRFTEIRLALKPGRRHRLRFSYLPSHYEQESVPEAPVVFGDATFPAGEPAMVDVQWTQYRFGYQYDLASTPSGVFGMIVELRRHQIEAAAAAGEVNAAVETRVTAPGIGFIARGYVRRSVSLTVEFSGFGVPGPIGRWLTDDDLDLTTRDVDVYVTANASRHLGVQGGYRYLRVDYTREPDQGELTVRGWYVGGLVRF